MVSFVSCLILAGEASKRETRTRREPVRSVSRNQHIKKIGVPAQVNRCLAESGGSRAGGEDDEQENQERK